MTQKKEPFYLTTAIAYTSGRPHIGNTYEIILSDAIARFKRAQGYDVFFQTGTDEHGVKIEEKAKAAGVTPQEFVDGVAAQIKSNWDLMNTSYDYFVRTTDDYHVKEVQSIFKRLYDQGDIYKGTYEGWYCTPCESFWTESQLVDGCCPDCGRPVKKAKEEAYFFNMQKYADRLIKYIEDHPDFIQPESRKNEMLNNFLRPGLQDLCVSRTSFSWGVPVDFDPKHVVYVWIDALSNYITTLGYHANGESDEKFKKYPQFLFPIFRNDIHEIVDYKQLILELDDTFNISRIYKDTISNSSRGIIYISSNFVDYNLGIEWRSINAFMFNESKIVKNIVKVSSDTDDSSLFTSNIISLDEIADADYEMNNRLQEQESEDYYEHIVKGEYDEIDDNYGFSYDVILLKDNDFYEIFDVEGEIIEDVIENNDFLRGYKFFNNIAVPDRYKGERFVFGKSELYQDGILLEFNPQCIVPIGVGYVIVNLTAESRLELNVSRHELNNNREIISKWNKRVGCVVQKKVAENCIRVLKENNLDFKIEDLLSQNVEGFFEKECLFNMKDILRELLM